MSKKIVVAIIFLAYCAGLAIGPRVPDDEQRRYCVKNIYLPGPFGISLNCDSPVFLENAADPALLLAEKAVYQGRPLQITLVGVLGYPLRLVTTPLLHALNLDRQMAFGVDVINKENEYRATTFESEADVTAGIYLFVPYFIAYFLFDVLLLIGAYGLYLRLVAPNLSLKRMEQAPVAVLVVGLLLVINDLTKAFFLTPHSQAFNLFVPLLALFVFVQLATAPNWRRVLSVAVVTGLGVLAYAYFIILAPVAVAALLIHYVPRLGGWRGMRRVIPFGVVITAVALLPMLGWYSYVVARNGAFFSFEVECCRQIVWMGDAWQAGGMATLVQQLVAKALFFLRGGVTLALIPLLIAGVVALVGWRFGRGSIQLSGRDRLMLAGAVLVSVISIVFYALIGYTVTRLATGSVMPLVVVVGILVREVAGNLPSRRARQLNIALVVTVTAVMAFELVKEGPYS